MTGRDGVDANPERLQFERHPFSTSRWRPRRCVNELSCHRMGADDGAEIDDAAAIGAEAFDGLLHHENRAEHVDVVVKVETLFGNLRESTEAEDARVVTRTSSLPKAVPTSLNTRATFADLETSPPTAIA